MIALKLGLLRSPAFSEAYNKMMDEKGYSESTLLQIVDTAKVLADTLTKTNAEYSTLAKAYAEKVEGTEDQWKVPEEKMVEWMKLNQEFHEKTEELNIPKFTLGTVSCMLTPKQYIVLSPLFS